MFTITSDNAIHITRGDIASFTVCASDSNEQDYVFNVGDVVRVKVFEKNRCDNIVMVKDFVVESESTEVDIFLDSSDTRIGDLIHRPKDYWYEIELNPDTAPQTIIAYDSSGPKIFRLFPEGDDESC